MTWKGKKKVAELRNDNESPSTGSLDYSWSNENEEIEGSRTPVHNPVTEHESTKRKRSELRSKAVHDPIDGVVPRVLPVLAPQLYEPTKSYRI